MARDVLGEGRKRLCPPPSPPPGPGAGGAERGESHGGKITCKLHSVTSGTRVFCLFKSPLGLEKEGPRNPSLVLPFRGKRAGISPRGVPRPVLVVGCSSRISLFKYVYSLQGCNYFDISVAASQSTGMRIAGLVHYCSLTPAMSQCGADDATTVSNAENSDVRQGMLNKPSRRLGTEEGELPTQKIKRNVLSCLGLAVLPKRD